MKYIIEIEDEPLTRQSALYGETAVYRAKGFKSLVFDEEGLSNLTPMPDSERIKEGAEAMTNEKAIELLDNLIGMVDDSHGNDYDEVFRMAIKAIEELATNLQQSCNQVATDCISRQAAIRGAECIIDHHHITPYRTIESVVEHFVRILNGLPAEQPPVEPMRKKRKWEEHKDYPKIAYLCSECGYFTTMRTHFCPNCGADMRGGRNEP